MITKQNSDLSGVDFNAGEVILVDKPYKKSSFNVIYRLRKAAGIKKAGHAGTLDPLATGLLIICTGKRTKEISEYQGLEKTYTGTITLGKTTPSMDAETEVIQENCIENVTPEKIMGVKESFLGKISQYPPMYSAVKFKGKSLYKYARKGIEVTRLPRDVFIHKFTISKIELPDICFEIVCSKGTYIRVLAHDLGQKLGCGAYLTSLRRTNIGCFNVDDALSIEEFETLARDLNRAGSEQLMNDNILFNI